MSSSKGRSSATPWRMSAHGKRARRGGDEALGRIDAGDLGLAEALRRALDVSAPGPQPTSSARPPAGSRAQSANSAASGREYRPMNLSYASAATSNDMRGSLRSRHVDAIKMPASIKYLM